MSNKKWSYKNPVDENGKPYWVPIVVKNKDVLTGIIVGMGGVETMIKKYLLPLENDNIYSSSAYTDLIFNGEKVSDLMEKNNNDLEKVNEHIKNVYIKKSESIIKSVQDQTENKDNSKMYVPYIDLECSCGFPVRFETIEEIPEENCNCPVCGKILIDYTHKEIEDMEYNGYRLEIDDEFEEEEEEDEGEDEWK